MKSKKIVIFIVIALCAGVALYSVFSGGKVLTPYVSFKDAVESGNYVQVMGIPDKSRPFDQKEGIFSFDMKESSVTSKAGDNFLMKVVYPGAKPNNFETADQVVVQGAYNKERKIFEAKKILVKCPSKYIKNK